MATIALSAAPIIRATVNRRSTEVRVSHLGHTKMLIIRAILWSLEVSITIYRARVIGTRVGTLACRVVTEGMSAQVALALIRV